MCWRWLLQLLGQHLVRGGAERASSPYIITETEAYRGEEDLACHASKGRTARTEVMYGEGGQLYMYLIYGMYWMMNVVQRKAGHSPGGLIQGDQGGRRTGKAYPLAGSGPEFYGEDLVSSGRIWIEESGVRARVHKVPRVGIDYAAEPWKSKAWRFLMIL